MSRILLTGTTGIVGSHLAHRLLQQGRSLVLLARDGHGRPASERVRGLFEHLDRLAPSGSRSRGTFEVLTGDITKPSLGLDAPTLERSLQDVSEIWHCAVLSSFDERRREDVEAANTTGSINVFDLAEAYGIARVHYLSTAFVAGNRRGRVYERLCSGAEFRNSYERTKCEAESYLMDRAPTTGLQATIYRLGIVVGDSRSGETTGFNGYYWLARALHALREDLASRQKSAGAVHLPMRIPCAAEATVNLVTIDFVTRVLDEISQNPDSVSRIVHVTNPNPINGRELWRNSLDHLGLRGFQFAESLDEIEREPTVPGVLPELEATMLDKLRHYVAYLQGEPVFDTTNAQALSGDFSHPSFTKELLGRLLDFGIKKNWHADF